MSEKHKEVVKAPVVAPVVKKSKLDASNFSDNAEYEAAKAK
jgi:hypothetical protein